jgi:hypothetical protein
MSIQIQHYFVYAIVFSATIKLLYPLFQLVYKKIKSLQHPESKEDPFSFYTPVCSKCGMKEKTPFEK